ncbi:MAG: xanthine phosphoribosyltransferase [Clostridiales Family XIII bacterium]|jgi:xanthine phosphoribosyltransferase|nr:xanthine phosphoribosyltransferase [Clostridiales Family XIII bacterium]
MEALKNRIIRDGLALGSESVKVDSFLNHQLDVAFLERLGEEFRRRFDGERIDKIMTVESSGIAVACMTARHFGYPPVVFAKKSLPSTLTEGYYAAQVRSFTRGLVSVIVISKKYLASGENVLIIDDFVAHGEAAAGMTELVSQAGARVAGVGCVIEKTFQGGGKRLRDAGYRVEALASIVRISDGKIIFST